VLFTKAKLSKTDLVYYHQGLDIGDLELVLLVELGTVHMLGVANQGSCIKRV